ncbi:MAG TPA: alpha/beta fold hydrolase [Thermoanaerobaculia bacterium]|jgi:pimeloyl-ACP methyl ester carboxylesterase/ketosteroid isomerase-like protein
MRLSVCALLAAIAMPAFAATPADEVRAAETAFAKAFADRDAAKFFSMVADDATFMGFRPLRGKQQVQAQWSRFFEGPAAPFSWGPERVEVTADGKIGLSTGPVYGDDGRYSANYSSIWRKEPDGSWKIIFDHGTGPLPLPENNPPFEEGFIPAEDGAKLHYRKIGRGPVTLIVPYDSGLHQQFRQFTDMATVVTYDSRSRGKSTGAASTIQQDVRDLETVRAFVKAEKFVPVGFSYYGKMVAMYALAHPEHVTRIVQVGAAEPAETTEMQAAEMESLGAPAADIARLRELRAMDPKQRDAAEYCKAELGMMRYLLVADPAHASRLEIPCDLPNEQPAHLFNEMSGLWKSVEETKLTGDDLKKIAVPVLVVHGEKDRNAPYASGQQWATQLPDARLVTVRNAAHAAWADDPVTVFASIRAFLRGDWPAGAAKLD